MMISSLEVREKLIACFTEAHNEILGELLKWLVKGKLLFKNMKD